MKKVFILIQIVFLFFANSVFAQTQPGGYSTCKSPSSNVGITPLAGDIYPSTVTSTPNTLFSVNSDIYINGNITFQNDEFMMGSGVTIYVNGGSRLILKGCHLYGCTDMWNGIYVSSDGTIQITGSPNNGNLPTLIEDAVTAVNIPSGANNTFNILDVDNTIFNRNYIGIQINDCGYYYSSKFSIQNTIFTSRELDFLSGAITTVSSSNTAWPTIQGFVHNSAGNLPYPNFYQANKSIYFYDAITYNQPNSTAPSAFLKPPHSFEKPYIGIYLSNNHSNLTIGNIGSTTFDNSVIFDNLDYGIFNSNTISNPSDLNVVNCVFQDPYIVQGATNASKHGYGIYMLGGNALNVVPVTNSSGSRGSAFYNLSCGIYSANNAVTNVQGCYMASEETISQSTSNKLGNNGINLITKNPANVTISNNSIYNIQNPINIKENNINTTVAIGTYNINGNNIDLVSASYSSASGLPAITGEIKNAISATSVSGLNSSSNNFYCNGNTIYKANNGISFLKWKKTNINAQDNIITLSQGYSGGQVGMQLLSCNPTGASNSGSFGNHLKHNSITTNSNGNTLNTIGIDVQMSYSTDVRCNYLYDCYKGVRFYGSCPSTKLAGNKFYNLTNNTELGLVLESGGSIPNQGIYNNNTLPFIVGCTNIVGEPSENQWLGTWSSPSYMTACLSNSNILGKNIYYGCNESADHNPSNSYRTIGSNGNFSSISYDSRHVILTDYPIIDENCYGSVYDVCNPSTCMATWRYLSNGVANTWVSEVDFGESLVRTDADNDTIPNYANSIYVAKQFLFNSLMNNDGTVADSILYYSTTLLNFLNQNQGNAFDKMYDIENALSHGDVGGASGLLSNFYPTNQIENNFVEYINFMIQYLNGTEFTEQNIADLYNLSMLCPTTNGECIYGARSLYSMIVPDNTVDYADVCGSDENQMGRSSTNQEVSTIKKNKSPFNVKVYPNPTASDGSVHISFENSKGYNKVIISDLWYKTLQEETVLPGINRLNLKLSYPKGVYLVTVTNLKTGIKEMKKIVLQ